MASNSSTEPERFIVGRLGRPHGLDGFIGLYIEDEDAAALEPGSTVFLDDRPHVVRAIRRVDRGYQIAFEDVTDRIESDEIRGLDVVVARRRELGDGEYWPSDLIGLKVVDQDGVELGTVEDVLFGPAQERLLIGHSDGQSFEIPFVDDLVPVVDLAQGRIGIVAIPGLTEPSDRA